MAIPNVGEDAKHSKTPLEKEATRVTTLENNLSFSYSTPHLHTFQLRHSAPKCRSWRSPCTRAPGDRYKNVKSNIIFKSKNSTTNKIK